MIRLGVGYGDRAINYPLHHPQFEVNESAIITGVVTLAYTAFKYWQHFDSEQWTVNSEQWTVIRNWQLTTDNWQLTTDHSPLIFHWKDAAFTQRLLLYQPVLGY